MYLSYRTLSQKGIKTHWDKFSFLVRTRYVKRKSNAHKVDVFGSCYQRIQDI